MIENGGNDMALQFILGSARSGKTDFIYDQMIKDSMEHEDEEFFFIVPDQSTLNAQKQLVTRHPRHGTFNIDVVGFFRLTYRVFEELSYIPKDLLEDEGKSMVIRKIMEQHKEELKVFASSMKKQGFIDELKSFFAEVYQYDVSMEDLKKITDGMKEEGLRSKMEDILLVMENFEDYIVEFEQNGEDRAAYGEQLLKKLEKQLNTKGLNERRFRYFRRLYLVYPQLKDEVLHYVMSGSKIRHTPSAKLQLTDRQNNALTLSPKKVFNKLPYSHLKSISH